MDYEQYDLVDDLYAGLSATAGLLPQERNEFEQGARLINLLLYYK